MKDGEDKCIAAALALKACVSMASAHMEGVDGCSAS